MASPIGIVDVVTLDENGEEGRHRVHRRPAGPFAQTGQRAEDRRRVTLGGRRFARGEADFAQGHRVARGGVHHQEHVVVAVAEALGDRQRGLGALGAQDRGLVRGHHHDDAARKPLRAQVPFEELAHLAASLADEGQDIHVHRRVAREHPQQHRLAHAAAGEDAEPLAAGDGDQAVDRAHSGRQLLAAAAPVKGAQRWARRAVVAAGDPEGGRRRWAPPGRRAPGRAIAAPWAP